MTVWKMALKPRVQFYRCGNRWRWWCRVTVKYVPRYLESKTFRGGGDTMKEALRMAWFNYLAWQGATEQ